MAKYLHSFRRGAIKGGDFVGANSTEPNFSPGSLAKRLDIVSPDFENNPDWYKRPDSLDNQNLGEKVLDITGQVIGIAANYCLLPQILAYVDKRRNHKRVIGIVEKLKRQGKIPETEESAHSPRIDIRDLTWQSGRPHDSRLYVCPVEAGSSGLYGTDGHGRRYRRYPPELTAILEQPKEA
jgi:hypothetical protein